MDVTRQRHVELSRMTIDLERVRRLCALPMDKAIGQAENAHTNERLDHGQESTCAESVDDGAACARRRGDSVELEFTAWR
jgi:hypothetical protein